MEEGDRLFTQPDQMSMEVRPVQRKKANLTGLAARLNVSGTHCKLRLRRRFLDAERSV